MLLANPLTSRILNLHCSNTSRVEETFALQPVQYLRLKTETPQIMQPFVTFIALLAAIAHAAPGNPSMFTLSHSSTTLGKPC